LELACFQIAIKNIFEYQAIMKMGLSSPKIGIKDKEKEIENSL